MTRWLSFWCMEISCPAATLSHHFNDEHSNVTFQGVVIQSHTPSKESHVI